MDGLIDSAILKALVADLFLLVRILLNIYNNGLAASSQLVRI